MLFLLNIFLLILCISFIIDWFYAIFTILTLTNMPKNLDIWSKITVFWNDFFTTQFWTIFPSDKSYKFYILTYLSVVLSILVPVLIIVSTIVRQNLLLENKPSTMFWIITPFVLCCVVFPFTWCSFISFFLRIFGVGSFTLFEIYSKKNNEKLLFKIFNHETKRLLNNILKKQLSIIDLSKIIFLKHNFVINTIIKTLTNYFSSITKLNTNIFFITVKKINTTKLTASITCQLNRNNICSKICNFGLVRFTDKSLIEQPTNDALKIIINDIVNQQLFNNIKPSNHEIIELNNETKIYYNNDLLSMTDLYQASNQIVNPCSDAESNDAYVKFVNRHWRNKADVVYQPNNYQKITKLDD